MSKAKVVKKAKKKTAAPKRTAKKAVTKKSPKARGSSARAPKRGTTTKATKPIAIMYVLDESGSMGIVKDATISGFNEYIRGVQKSPTADKDRISLITFNSEQGSNMRINGVVSEVSDLTSRSFSPTGMTPLYDAVNDGIRLVEAKQKTHDIFFVIHTDGQENYSKNTTLAELNKRITEKQAKGWKFIFLGAGQDAWIAAGALNIGRMDTLSYDHNSRDTARAFQVASLGTYNYGLHTNSERKNYTLSETSSNDIREGKDSSASYH